MKRRALAVLLIAGCAREQTPLPDAKAPAAGTEPAHWDYGTAKGPVAWGSLDAKYSLCSTGRAQSPVDIVGATRATSGPIVSSTYRPTPLRIVHHEAKADLVNTGHSIQVNAAGDDTVLVGSDRFALVQFHFHSPSEHTVAGASFPLEMHLVHRSADGRLAVVGVLIREGAYNTSFEPIWSKLPEIVDREMAHDSVMVNIDALLPDNRTHYRYDGSLTTPPCAEGVKWFVLETPVELSAAQIAALRAVLSGNSRPVQPLHGRALTEIIDKR